jgi:hypothetical protein
MISDGRVVKSYLGLGYAGVEPNPSYNPATALDISAMNTFHVDVWTTANQIAIKLVSTINGAAPEIIYPDSSGVITSNHWVSLDIPLSAFTNLVPTLDLTHFDQLLWVDNGDIPGSGVQQGDFYIDNVYFYSNSVVVPPAPITVYVDPSQSWSGYMNVFDLPVDGGAYEFGSTWGTDALPAVFNGAVLTLSPNTNNYNPSDPYWVNPDGSGNKTCDASMYVQNDNLAGQVVIFTGYCQANTVVSPYASTAFIKDFNSGYGLNGSISIPLTNGQPFNFSLATAAGDHIQYGFETIGPVANPVTVASLGSVMVSGNTSPAITTSLSGGMVHMSFPTQTGLNYTIQYKTNLTDSVWQTLSTSIGNGSTQAVPDTANQKSRFYRVYVH